MSKISSQAKKETDFIEEFTRYLCQYRFLDNGSISKRLEGNRR